MQIIQDEAAQESYRAAGLETAQSFSVERMMDCTYQAYQQLLAD